MVGDRRWSKEIIGVQLVVLDLSSFSLFLFFESFLHTYDIT